MFNDIVRQQITETSTYEERRSAEILNELGKRKMEALNLYEPQPFQQRFHECLVREVALIAGNQCGKSLAGAVEVARCVTNQDPYNKYPESGLVVCVGLDEGHITRMHDYLLRAGEFKVIWDPDKGEYGDMRVFDPVADEGREDEAVPAPALIPRRLVKEIAWISKKERKFSKIMLRNGWEIRAYGSRGEPAAGFKADLIWFDEDIIVQSWYDEMLARLSMQKKGRLIWTAIPLSKNDAMVNLIRRAEEEESNNEEERTAAVFRATIWDNKFMPPKQIEKNVKAWKAMGDEVFLQRAKGIMSMDARQMYPAFNRQVHCLPKDGPQKILEVLKERGWQPPEDWCRYTSTDPGHSICAVAIFAVPPPHIFGRYVIQYDELYIRMCNAHMYGEQMFNKVGRVGVQAHIIDEHMGRQTQMGSGETVKKHYSDALRNYGVKSYGTGYGFIAGSDDVAARCTAVREILSIRADVGQPTYLLVGPNCPNTIREFQGYNKKVRNVSGTMIIEDKPEPKNNHLMNAIEYAAAYKLPYVRPPAPEKPKTPHERWRERKDEERKNRGNRGPLAKLFEDDHITLGPRGA